MAGVSVLPSNKELLLKRVQEMDLHGEELPHQFICRDGTDRTEQDSQLTPLPIIDLELLSSPEPSTQEVELHKLLSALSSWGCFQAIGHGMTSSFLDNFRQVVKEFFEQPMEIKKKYSKEVEEFEGYGADPPPVEGQPLDWSDRLFLNIYPQVKRNTKFWPESPTSFRPVLEEYTGKIKAVTEILSKAMAKSLNLEEKCFLDQFGEGGQLQARFNYYPPCPRPDHVLGLKAHSDSTGYTVILQEKITAVQVLKDDKWFTISLLPYALLIIVGDQMEIMSNGIFKSPVHRVLTSSKRGRISVPMFYSPDAEKEIGPEEGLISYERPKLFKKVKNYEATYWEHYKRGERAIKVAKLV